MTELLIQKLGKNAAGKTALKWLLGTLGEGGEEMLSDVVNPIIRSIYNGQSIGENYSELELAEVLYDGLVGAALGGLGGAVDIKSDTKKYALPGPETVTEGAKGAAADYSLPGIDGVSQKAAEAANGTAEVSVTSGPSALKGQKGLGYTLASNIGKIENMLPVASLSGTEMNQRSKPISEQISDFFKSVGNMVTRMGLGEVQLGEYGIGGELNHRPINRGKMVTIEAVPQVIKHGRLIADDDNWKGRGYRSMVFAAPVTIAGRPVYVAAVVDQRPDNKFYLHEVVDSDGNYIRVNESPPNGTKSGVTVHDGVTATPGELSGISIPESPGKSNSENSYALPTVEAEAPATADGDALPGLGRESRGAVPEAGADMMAEAELAALFSVARRRIPSTARPLKYHMRYSPCSSLAGGRFYRKGIYSTRTRRTSGLARMRSVISGPMRSPRSIMV